MHEIDRIIEAAKKMQRGILATVVATHGSTYRRAGARVVISETGEAVGTISGGCLERDLAARSAEWLAEMQPRLITYDSTRDDDLVFGMGLGCRGIVDLYIEPFDAAHPPRLVREFRWAGRQAVTWTTSFEGRLLLAEAIRPPRTLAIFGGGADVEPLARLAEAAGFDVSRFSPRDVHPERVRDRVDLTRFDAAVVMTHNYLYDLELLGAILPSAIPYAALLGPRSRGDELLAKLEGVTPEQRARLHNPAGLDLGAETPEEIALSIVSEIEATLKRRSAQPLRQIGGPVHARPPVPAP